MNNEYPGWEGVTWMPQAPSTAASESALEIRPAPKLHERHSWSGIRMPVTTQRLRHPAILLTHSDSFIPHGYKSGPACSCTPTPVVILYSVTQPLLLRTPHQYRGLLGLDRAPDPSSSLSLGTDGEAAVLPGGLGKEE